MLRWCVDDDMNLASPSECFGDLYRLIADEMHIRLTGASSPIDSMRRRRISDNICGAKGPFPAAAAMVMSCCWWLARLRRHKSYTHTIRNSIIDIPNVFVAGLKYFFWPIYYSACPAMPNRI
jgi:hypothetical protein